MRASVALLLAVSHLCTPRSAAALGRSKTAECCQTAVATATAIPCVSGDRQGQPRTDASGDSTLQVPFDLAKFDSVTAFALRAVFDSAAERGLPTAPLVNRALEGAARHANGALIVRVVRAHAAALSEARDVLGTESTAAELDAGATALRSGIDARTLAAVRATRSAGAAVTPLMVLTDIVQRGVPSVAARDAVTSLARMPRSDDALMGLQVTVAKNAMRGPGMAVDALNRYLRGTVPGSNSPSAPATVDRKPIRTPTL